MYYTIFCTIFVGCFFVGGIVLGVIGKTIYDEKKTKIYVRGDKND